MPSGTRNERPDAFLHSFCCFQTRSDRHLVLYCSGQYGSREKKIRHLADFPEIGFRRDELRPGLCSVSVGQYIIFYKPLKTGDGIQLVRVLAWKAEYPEHFQALTPEKILRFSFFLPAM